MFIDLVNPSSLVMQGLINVLPLHQVPFPMVLEVVEVQVPGSHLLFGLLRSVGQGHDAFELGDKELALLVLLLIFLLKELQFLVLLQILPQLSAPLHFLLQLLGLLTQEGHLSDLLVQKTQNLLSLVGVALEHSEDLVVGGLGVLGYVFFVLEVPQEGIERAIE